MNSQVPQSSGSEIQVDLTPLIRPPGFAWGAGTADTSGMTPEERSRYSRHMLLAQIGEAGQERLLAARVLVVGMGGLGSPVTMYLAASGVGHLVLTDFDVVELSNLQRQIIHHTDDVGENKVESARSAILDLNPGIRVTAIPRAIEDEELEREVTAADVVVDACDNFESRFELNAICWRLATARSRCSTPGERRAPATAASTATSPPRARPAPRWGCWRRCWASSAASRPPRP